MTVTEVGARPVKPYTPPYTLQGDGHTYQLDKASFEAALRAAMTASGPDRTIGTGEAARILGVSRKTVQRILDAGRIPYRRNGDLGNRIMREADVLAYRNSMASNRRQALNRMSDQANQMSMYNGDQIRPIE